jgi:HprK-related kinase A
MTSALLGHRAADLNDRELGSQGLRFVCGPLTISLEIAPRAGRGEFLELYREYPLADENAPEGIVDFHIRIDSPTRLRRWFKPHVLPFTGIGFMPFAPLPADLTMVTIEMGFNWQSAMVVPGHLIFHAGVVERGGRAIIMPGSSGTGKSTLSSGLSYHGWRLFSDEFGLLRLSDGQIVPYPRPVSLKNQSGAVMQAVAPAARFSRPYHGTPKGTITYLLPPADSIARMHEPATPSLLVFPVFEPNATAQIQKMSKAEAFILLRNCSVNAQWLGRPAFEALNRIVEGCEAYRIVYSSLDMGMALIDQLTAEW